MALRITHWIVEDMVRTLTDAPDTCILLGKAHWPADNHPRYYSEGGRISLVRYLWFRVNGDWPPRDRWLRPGCKTAKCQNPHHRVLASRNPKEKIAE